MSIAAFAGHLPAPGNLDNADRFSATAAALKQAPMGAAGREYFDRAESAVALFSDADGAVSGDHVMCLLLISRYRCFSGDAFAGIEPAVRAVDFARRLGEPGLTGKALKTLGTTHLETGNYPDAITALGRALIIAKEKNDLFEEVNILSNLGLAHQYSGHYGEALPCYELAAEIADTAPKRMPQVGASATVSSIVAIKAAALGNLALACLHMRDFSRGLSAAERAVATLEHAEKVNERQIRSAIECYYTRLLLEVKNLPLARKRAKLAREFASGTTELAEMMADMAQGLVEMLDRATRDLGLSRLQRVVNASRKGTASTLRDALATIVRGYEIAGQPNAALVYLHEVIQLNKDSRVKNVLRHHKRHLQVVSGHLDGAAEAALGQQREDLRFQRLSIDALRECMLVLERNTVAAELHDDETGEHCYRVGALARELAIAHGMDPEMCSLIDLSARLHDIGKLRVPDSILLKPGRFTASERSIMEKHCEHGWELIGEGGLAQLFVAQEIALNHHERWDGTGYPNHRRGNMIPLAARVTALADVFDALTHKRCYKPAWSVEDALQEIGRLRGLHFDPELTDIFLDLVPRLQRELGDLDGYLGAEARKNDFVTERARVAREVKLDFGTFDVRR